MKQAIIFVLFIITSLLANAQTGKYYEISALQSDSLINANSINPNFVILDIRTAEEHNPKHLLGAINMNYYVNFDQKLDSLDKQKIYLLHCQSGSRSAGAFAKMKAKNFSEVYNMKSGIKEWMNKGLPVTSAFAPLLMFASDTIFPEKEVIIGVVDTIKLRITNRANDTLQISTISDIPNPEFFTDFDTDTMLLGAADYAFNIYYLPKDDSMDSLTFTISSNGGTKTVKIYRSGILTNTLDLIRSTQLLKGYPNPASRHIHIVSNNISEREYQVFDVNGHLLKRYKVMNAESIQTFDIMDLQPGVYFINEISGNGYSVPYQFIKI